MKLSKCKNCILIVYGIIIVCLWIQNLNIDTKEFAVPGSSQTFDGRAWENLNVLLNAFVSRSGTESGGSRRLKLTLPSNIHIKGNLLVGSYNCPVTAGSFDCSRDTSTFDNSIQIIRGRVERDLYIEPNDSTSTGNIYSWNAKHREVDTCFITRGYSSFTDSIWFQSHASYIKGDPVDNNLVCYFLRTNKIKGERESGDLELLDPIETARWLEHPRNPIETNLNDWQNEEWGPGRTNSVNASLMVTGKTEVHGKLDVYGDVRLWDMTTYVNNQEQSVPETSSGGGTLMLNSRNWSHLRKVCAPLSNNDIRGNPWSYCAPITTNSDPYGHC
jgi:hypothetical protein